MVKTKQKEMTLNGAVLKISDLQYRVNQQMKLSKRQLEIKDVMIDTLDRMLTLEKKESRSWRLVSIILLVCLITCTILVLIYQPQ